MTRPRLLLAVGVLSCVAGLVLFGQAGIIHAKAWMAQALLERSWAQRLAGVAENETRPWPWADTAPVARLQVRRLGIDRIVLAGASGRTLAFGPAHLGGTAAPGDAGHSIVTGHRDTHFAFLRDLAEDDEIHLQSPDGVWHVYRVTGSTVLDARTAGFDPMSGRDILTLVTCFPFEALTPSGPLRYAVFGEAVTPVVQSARPVRHAVHSGTDRQE